MNQDKSHPLQCGPLVLVFRARPGHLEVQRTAADTHLDGDESGPQTAYLGATDQTTAGENKGNTV